MIDIGILTFRSDPFDAIPGGRLRAMLAEAVLQGARLRLIDAGASDATAVCGYCWTDDGWVKRPIPVPDVTFVIGVPVTAPQEAVLDAVQRESTVIQDVELDKLAQMQLFQASTAKRFVIPTEQLLAEDLTGQVTDFLRTHGNAVIKRSDGNKGVGLLFALADGTGWRLVRDGTTRTGSLEEVAMEISRRVAGRITYRDFLIQRYVPNTGDDDRAVDIRVHVQRRAGGAWGVTRSYVRLGELGRQTANVSKGGYQGHLPSFLESRSQRPASEIAAEMTDAALEIAEIQSAAAPRPLSELGLDFLLDREDQIWLVETNTLPQSSLHEHPRAEHSIAYAIWLASK